MARAMANPKREVQVQPSSHLVAIAQARAFYAQAAALEKSIIPGDRANVIGQQIAFLVTVGLTIELYFKAYMIRARGGRVTLGHNLSVLLQEFPDYFRAAFTAEYDQRFKTLPQTYVTTAILISKEQPTKPEGLQAMKFNSFEACVASLSDAFIRFRYLFEDVSDAEWTQVPFPNPYALAAIQTLDAVYIRFEEGYFRSRVGAP